MHMDGDRGSATKAAVIFLQWGGVVVFQGWGSGSGEMVRTLRRRNMQLGSVGLGSVDVVGGLAANSVNWNNTIDFLC
jgi:hypothetical protein